MRENTVKSIRQGGSAAVSGWMGIPIGVAVEGMVQAGWGRFTAIPSNDVTGARSTGKSAGGSMY